jgi:ATP-dependent Clp protease ATP-binding subunit ClpA
MGDSHSTPLSEDATLVTALAATAMPFAGSGEAQAETWIRTLRLHGRVGAAMQALGVGEAPLRAEYDLDGTPRPATSPPQGDVARQVVARSQELANAEGSDFTGTTHVLTALFEVYGDVFERALELHGATRTELEQRLDETPAHAEAS